MVQDKKAAQCGMQPGARKLPSMWPRTRKLQCMAWGRKAAVAWSTEVEDGPVYSL
jgi:hypothetical protein